MESEAQYALPQERERAQTNRRQPNMRCRFKADPKFTFAIRPDAPKPNCQNPKWRRANAASTTPAISRFTALFADMAKGLSVFAGHRVDEDGY